jgi:hypothetical protein
MTQPYRIMPIGHPADYQTFRMTRRSDTSIVQACKEAGCEQWAKGWETHIDENTSLGRGQAAYIRRESGRTFTEHRTVSGLTVFRFPSGQRCFAEHRTQPMLYVVQGGDWRQRRGLLRQHVNGDDWVDDFATHQDRVKTQLEKG